MVRLLLLLFCFSVSAAEIQFRDVADEWGVGGVVGTTGSSDYSDLSYVNGCGVAVGDVNADGRMDLYVVQGGAPNLLFLHRGDHYEEVAAAFGVDDAGRGAGAVLCDMNGDAFPELLLTNFGPDRYFLNVGGERFELVEGFSDDGMGMGMAVADYDGDGLGDVYVARYIDWPENVPRSGGACQWKGLPVICGPEAYRPMADLYYSGDVDGGLVSSQPMPLRPFAPGRGMGVIAFGLGDSEQPSIYVANDASDNFLFVRGEVGQLLYRWEEKALGLGCALSAEGKPQAGMGIAPGDIDGDGLEDLVITHFDGQRHALYMQKVEGWFEDESQARGLGAPSLPRLSWGAQLADFDNDGDLDLHVVNGHLYFNADDIGDGTTWKQPDDLFINDGTGHFTPLPDGWDGVTAESGRGSAVVDFDDDGLLDLVVWNLGGPLRLLRNETVGAGSWTRIQLEREAGLSEAAIVGRRVIAGDNMLRVVRRGSGYLGCSDPRLHFGLGQRTSVELAEGANARPVMAGQTAKLRLGRR